MKETTAGAWTDYVRQNHATARPTELFLNSDSTRLEQGSNHSMRVVTPAGQVQIGAQNPSYMHFTTDRENFYFSRPVLAVDKLAIFNAGQSGASTTYLAQSEGRINNGPILTAANAAGGVRAAVARLPGLGRFAWKALRWGVRNFGKDFAKESLKEAAANRGDLGKFDFIDVGLLLVQIS